MTPAALAPETSQHVAAVPEREDRHSFFAEAFGNGLVYSVNYERLFAPCNIGLRVGASFFSTRISTDAGSGNLTIASFPMVVSYYFGFVHHKVQLGLGATLLFSSSASDSAGVKFETAVEGLGVAATAVVGYRYFPRASGFTFAAGFTPLLRPVKGFLPWGGVSAGYIF